MSSVEAAEAPPTTQATAASSKGDDARQYWYMTSGQRTGALIASVCDAELAAVRTRDLASHHFGAEPPEVPGWADLSKSKLHDALRALQSAKLKQEKANRRLAADNAVATAMAASGSGAKRPRTLGEERTAECNAARGLAETTWAHSSAEGVHVVIDCSFNAFMTQREINSLRLQIGHSYGTTRSAEKPVRLILTSIDDSTLTELRRATGFQLWKCDVFAQQFSEVFRGVGPVALPDARDVDVNAATASAPQCAGARLGAALQSPGLAGCVYLTADSPNVLRDLDPRTVYIIGGIIDKNRHKGLTAKLCLESGVATARLPLDEYASLGPSTVLTTNHVVALLTHYSASKDWGEAIHSIFPKRKVAAHCATSVAIASPATTTSGSAHAGAGVDSTEAGLDVMSAPEH